MHFGYLIEPGIALPAAIFLEDLVKDVRGNLGKALDWQRGVEVGQQVLYGSYSHKINTYSANETSIQSVRQSRLTTNPSHSKPQTSSTESCRGC